MRGVVVLWVYLPQHLQVPSEQLPPHSQQQSLAVSSMFIGVFPPSYRVG